MQNNRRRVPASCSSLVCLPSLAIHPPSPSISSPRLPSLPALCTSGPILLEDYQLVEKLAGFDRERIPERVVHARGASAKGFFEVGGRVYSRARGAHTHQGNLKCQHRTCC